MNLKKLTYYLFFALISLIGLTAQAQEVDSSRYKRAIDKPMRAVKKSKKQKQPIDHDLRVGIDISNLILGAMTPIRVGLDLSLEYNVTPNLYVMLEGGYNYYKRENDRVTYTSKGNYIRLGLDYNVRKTTEVNDRDIYYIGFRNGFSRFTQEVPNYVLLNGFWGNTVSNMPEEQNYAHWMELLTGFKVEVLKNWYLGMGVRTKFFLYRNKTSIEPVQYVPGYARNYSSAVLSFNYTIYYNIPLNYKKKKIAVYEE